MTLIDADVTGFKNPRRLRTINRTICLMVLRGVPQIDHLTCCRAFWHTVRLQALLRGGTAERSCNARVGQNISKDCLPLV